MSRELSGEFSGGKEKGPAICSQALDFSGARSWTRTNDPLINRPVAGGRENNALRLLFFRSAAATRRAIARAAWLFSGGLIAISAFAWLREPTVTLTFDDGPQDVHADAEILAVLRKHHAPAVWFVNCKWLPEHAVMLRQIAAEGHAIGNHGYDHLPLAGLSPAELAHEVGDCSREVYALTGHAPRYFRPTWGRSTPEADQLVASLKMRTMLWSADSRDHAAHFFRDQPAAYAAFLADNPSQDVGLTAKDGNVILFHDYPNTAATLNATLTKLEQRGFRFALP
jgi:peptidoglycan/xylan/chitin deacetylase (PgdA/CDA1 family)